MHSPRMAFLCISICVCIVCSLGNIAGDQLFMPFLGGEKRKEKSKYRGVREGRG